ncbi:MAG: ATP-dependent Clp protease ATP-binding subunit [Myxococcota bacterium]|nr:ATP-dependent Clp protease ATP-binding subunit [Myxococcota bacterium]
MSATRESELTTVRKLAEELAKGRAERVTTGHLLAAMASTSGGAADLLKERRLGAEVLLKAARVLTDDHSDAVTRVMQRARELAARSPSREANATHLLFALCQERTTAAYRAVAQCGSDVTKLRTAAMQVAMGLVVARRVPAATQLSFPRTSPPQRSGGHRAEERIATVTATATATAPTAAAPTPGISDSSHTRPKRHRAQAPSAGASGSPHARFQLDPKRFPTLAAVGTNLTLAAARGELDPVFGREAEIDRTLDVLAKRKGNCPCLVGSAGVGKTSLVKGLAQRIADGRDVGTLDDRILIEVGAAALLSGTGLRGAIAERMAQIKIEAGRAEGRVVLFFDELQSVLGADDELAAELKAALAQGQLAYVVATTPEDYRRIATADPALARLMTPVEIAELGPEEALLALERVAPAFERFHGIRFLPGAIASAVALSARYVPDRALPDKAVNVLDLAGARAKRRGEREVGPEQVAEVLCETTGVPLDRLLETDGARMLRLEQLLGERVVGHGEALRRISRVLRRNASGFRSRRPIGTFLLLGPTGVGKTETAKAIAESLFHSPHAMTRIDLSEYAEPHAIARLVGAPPGYIGHEAGGQLTEAARKRPYQVLLLDEVEKAHRDVQEAFLQLFDEGRMTDGRGRTIDFTNVVVVMTSNLGADVAHPKERARIGFGARAARDLRAYDEAICAAARAELPPELYNRIDEVLAFAPLGQAEVAEVARRMLRGLGDELQRVRGVRLDFSEPAIEALLVNGGFDAELGARPMRRAIGRLVETPIAEMILRGELHHGDTARVDAENGEIAVDAVRSSPAKASA